MRSFVALEMPEAFRHETAGLARQLEAVMNGRFIDPANYHLTLAFLGDISRQDVQSACAVLDAVCAHTLPITIAGEGLGKFGKSHDATLWLGVAPNGRLMRLCAEVRDGLEAQGVPFDSKTFKPHITLARRARIPAKKLASLAFPEPCVATSLTLFKSELSAEGALYTPIHSALLKPSSPE